MVIKEENKTPLETISWLQFAIYYTSTPYEGGGVFLMLYYTSLIEGYL